MYLKVSSLEKVKKEMTELASSKVQEKLDQFKKFLSSSSHS